MRDEKLEHYGVPGMKWGKRTKRQTQTIPKNRKRTIKEGGKLHKSNLKTIKSMSKQLDKLSPERRAQYEQAFANINRDVKMSSLSLRNSTDVIIGLLGGPLAASVVAGVRTIKTGEASAGRELDKLNE